MMRKNYQIMAFILLVLINLPFLHAVDLSRGQVEFNIRFFDRRIYYVESDPIYVQVTITNNSPAPFRFKLADERAFSIDFDVRTMTNRLLPQSDLLTRKRTQNSQIFFREVVLETGESFSFVEDIREYVSFGQPGSFLVRAIIYPELYRSGYVSSQISQTGASPAFAVIESNFLNLTLRPASIQGPDGIPLEMDVATGAVLVRQQLPPDQVVSYMLTARQQSQWERFFLYLDLDSMLQRDPVQRRRYLAENEGGRLRLVAEYRQTLQNPFIDTDISAIPTTFDILRTAYTNNEGTVTVLQRYRTQNFTELRQYTYFLERKEDFWIIVNYSVQGMGTTAND